MNTSSMTSLAVMVLSAASLCVGCEQGRAREIERPALETSARAVRVNVPSSGLKQLIGRRLEAGQRLALRLAAQPSAQSPEQTIGPIEQTIRISQITIGASNDQAPQTRQVRLSGEDLLVVVPMRIPSTSGGVELCRWQLLATKAAIEAQWVIGAAPGQLDVGDAAEATLTQPRLDTLGRCQALESVDMATRAALEDELARYVRRALEEALTQALKVDVVEALGLLKGGLELTRLSNFANRRGQLILASEPTPAGALSFDGQGLKLDLDWGAQLTLPAECSPPIELPALTLPAMPTLRLEQSVEVAIGLPVALLERLLHIALRAGFVCQGLQAVGLTPDGSLPLRDVLLDELGLPTTRLGPQVHISYSAGELPSLSADPSDGTIVVQWPGLTVELYGSLDGALVRLLELRTDARFRARPGRSESGQLAFKVETMQVSELTLSSDWLEQPPDPAQLDLWARRFMLITLGAGAGAESILEVPLPLRPSAAGEPGLELERAKIVDEALVLELGFEEL